MSYKIVWDTEYTSWEGCNENGWNSDQNQYKEIIQIGAVKLDENNNIIDWFNRFVQPIINPDLSKYIKQLTGITQIDVDTTRRLPIVWNEFINWQGNNPAFSWGNDIDVISINKQLYKSVANKKMESSHTISMDKVKSIEFNPDLYYDIRPILKIHGIPTENYTSGTVCEYLSEDYTIDQHNAVEDARSLALTLQDIQ